MAEDQRIIGHAIRCMEPEAFEDPFIGELSGSQRAYSAMVIARDTESSRPHEPASSMVRCLGDELRHTLRNDGAAQAFAFLKRIFPNRCRTRRDDRIPAGASAFSPERPYAIAKSFALLIVQRSRAEDCDGWLPVWLRASSAVSP
ncbi:MAG: hypothetical protein ACI4O7_13815 [Aristaeellaceae bacterium]